MQDDFLDAFRSGAASNEHLTALPGFDRPFEVRTSEAPRGEVDGFASALLNPDGRQLDELAVSDLSRLRASAQGRLEELAYAAWVRIEALAASELARDRLLRFPLEREQRNAPPAGLQRPSSSFRYFDCMMTGGWCIVLEVDAASDDELWMRMNEIETAKRDWVLEVRHYIQTRT